MKNSREGQTNSAAAEEAYRRAGTIRVLVIDDHPAIRQALSDLVAGQADMEMCGAAATAREGMRLIQDQNPLPDVVVVDIALGDAHGLDVVQHIRRRYDGTQVVVFSVYDESLYAERAISMGALSYLMKSEPTQHVVDAIRSVYQGDVYLSRRMASRILGKVVRQQHHRLGAALDDLTDRERKVFELLGEGYSMRDIMEHLDLNRKTVETYRRRAREKLGFETTEELLQYAVQWTYRKTHTLDAKSEEKA